MLSNPKEVPFDSDCQGDEKTDCVGYVVQRINHFRPEINVDGCCVGDQLESFLQAVLNEGEASEERVNDAKHDDQLY